MRQPTFDPGKDAMSYALDLLTVGEGFRPTVYYDSIGKKSTAGYGFTAPQDLHTWTEPAARRRLTEMARGYDTALRNGRIGELYAAMTPKLLAALIDLLHQGGTGVLKKMPKFVEAVQKGDLNTATRQLDFGMKLTKNRVKARQAFFRPTTVTPKTNVVTEKPDAIVVQKPVVISDPYNDVKLLSTINSKIDTQQAILNILQSTPWNSSFRLRLPSLQSQLERFILPIWTVQ